MTSKERVRRSIRREPVDRPPIFLWYHPDTQTMLARELDIDPESVARVMGNDIDMTWVNNNYAMEGIVHEHEGERHTDAWGIEWERRGPFNQIVRYPLQDAEAADLEAYRFPYDHIDSLVRLLDPVVAGDPTVFLGCDVSPCAFELHNRLRGMEQSMLDLATNDGAARSLLARCAEFAAALAVRALETYELEMLWTGDDVGSQNSMLLAPQMWRELVAPELEKVVDVGRSRGAFVAYHSCGAVEPILGDLIDMGIDAVNPIQPQARGMDPATLKREFGSELVFIGGVDTQDLLPNADAATVRRETERLIEVLTADGGGFVVGASHTVPPETPLSNIFALLAAAGVPEEEIRDRAADHRAAGYSDADGR